MWVLGYLWVTEGGWAGVLGWILPTGLLGIGLLYLGVRILIGGSCKKQSRSQP